METLKSATNFLIRQLCRGYFATLRVRIASRDREPVSPEEYPIGYPIYAHYERDTLALVPMLRWCSFISMVDRGRDGDWATSLLQPAGLIAIRGSSLHGSRRATLELCREMARRPIPSVLCVDGPAGPAGVAKAGVFWLGRQSRRPVIPVSTSASRFVRVASNWSEMRIPLPFSKLVIACGTPIEASDANGSGPGEPLQVLLDTELREARNLAEQTLARWQKGELAA